MDNYFTALNGVDVSGKTEQKNGLTYLSWAWAWSELKKRHPEASYTVYEDAQGRFYHTDGHTCWVKTGVTVDGLEHIEYLPVMDFRNQSIPADKVTSTDVNRAIQRSLTKAVARHGLGLYIYAGEDLPEEKQEEKRPDPVLPRPVCADCGGGIGSARKKNGEVWKAEELAAYTERKYGRPLCAACTNAAEKAEQANGTGV